MRGHLLLVAVILVALLGGLVVAAAGLDSLTVHVTVTSQDYQLVEGVFDLPEPEASITVKPGTDLYRWLAAHRGQRVVMTVREYRGVKE